MWVSVNIIHYQVSSVSFLTVCLGWSPNVHYSDSFLQEAHLLHWNGPFKPWNHPAVHEDLWEKWFIPDPSKKFSLVRPERDRWAQRSLTREQNQRMKGLFEQWWKIKEVTRLVCIFDFSLLPLCCPLQGLLINIVHMVFCRSIHYNLHVLFWRK